MERDVLVTMVVIIGVVGMVAIVAVVAIVSLATSATQAPEIVVVKEIPAPSRPANIGTDPLGPGTLFLASATILAFAVFGSALSMKVRRKPKIKDISWYARVFNSIFILGLTGVQAWFMFRLASSAFVDHSWQMNFLVVERWVFLTALCLIGITACVTLARSYSASEAANADPS